MDAADAVETLYATAHELLTGGRTNDAVAVFRAMLIVAPTDERAWLGVALCHVELDQPEVAISLLDTAQEGDVGGARCALARARLLRVHGSPEETRSAYLLAAETALRGGEREIAELAHSEGGL